MSDREGEQPIPISEEERSSRNTRLTIGAGLRSLSENLPRPLQRNPT